MIRPMLDDVPINASHARTESRRPNVLSLSRHVPSLSGSATRSVAQNEARKRRANERHVVGCCEELAGPKSLATYVPAIGEKLTKISASVRPERLWALSAAGYAFELRFE